jgi:hypothetical protein
MWWSQYWRPTGIPWCISTTLVTCFTITRRVHSYLHYTFFLRWFCRLRLPVGGETNHTEHELPFVCRSVKLASRFLGSPARFRKLLYEMTTLKWEADMVNLCAFLGGFFVVGPTLAESRDHGAARGTLRQFPLLSWCCPRSGLWVRQRCLGVWQTESLK